ncbi:MAG TPA: glycerol-3-phosphate 1-O-acyltransferase PlsY [Methylomirabilota bacterium]
MTAALALGAAYLVGAVPIGYLVGRAFGIGDIRRRGSGNIGATNVLRTAGRVPAVLTLLGDIVKGWSAVALGALLSGGDTGVTALSAVAAVIGNCWSVFLGFRGGKGVATGFGALLRLVPLATLPAAVVWIAVTVVWRYVSLGSLVAALCVPVAALLLARYPGASVLAAAAVAVIVVARHHENIARLLAGSERRLGQRPA